MHRGHIYILKRIRAKAEKLNIKSLLITFYPHPEVFHNKEFSGYITTTEEKARLLESLGLDYFWRIGFNKGISRLRGEKFIKYIQKFFDLEGIIAGEDFRFGYKAENDVADLKSIGKKYGIHITKVKKKKFNGITVNSSLIRRLIKRQRFGQTKKLLGRPYSFSGRVEKGKSFGRKKLNIPTINLVVAEKVLPPPGVYLSKVKYRQNIYAGVSNLGCAPTFSKKGILLETHILNFNKSIYKDYVEVVLIKRLRAEKKFSSTNELKKQIDTDIKSAKKFSSNHNILCLP